MTRRQDAAEKTLHDQTNILPRTQLLIVTGCLALTLLITFIDQNGISVALPNIAESLHAQATMSWAGTSSLVANTVFQMLYGRLSDIFGRKTVYLCATGLLCLADLLCGLAQNPAMLYVFRGFAGVAGGGITNLTMIIVSDIVTLEDRGKYQGIIGSVVGLGNVIGPFIAAAFIERSTWRGFFWLLSPLAIVCGVVAFFLLPSSKPESGFKENAKKIDYAGVFASSVAVIFLLIPISGGGAYFPWDSPMIISFLVIGSCALIAFVLVEWKIAKLPMMPVKLFKDRDITTLLCQSFLLGAVYQSYLYYLPLYYQNVRQYAPLTSAALTTPVVVVQSIASVLSGQYISRRKRYGEVIWLGYGCWTLGIGLTCLFTRHTHPAILIIILCLTGWGVGCTFQPTLIALQAHSPKSLRAVVISNRNFFRCAGGACGLAVSAAIMQATLRDHLPVEFKALADSTYKVPKGLTGPELDVVLEAYMKASRSVFILCTPLIGLCFLGCALVRDRGLERPGEKEDHPGAENAVVVDEEMQEVHDVDPDDDEERNQVRSDDKKEKSAKEIKGSRENVVSGGDNDGKKVDGKSR